MTFTIEQKIACLERELNMRKRAYPKWVAAGHMTDHQATREIMLMAAILEDYRKKAAERQPDLFR